MLFTSDDERTFEDELFELSSLLYEAVKRVTRVWVVQDIIFSSPLPQIRNLRKKIENEIYFTQGKFTIIDCFNFI